MSQILMTEKYTEHQIETPIIQQQTTVLLAYDLTAADAVMNCIRILKILVINLPITKILHFVIIDPETVMTAVNQDMMFVISIKTEQATMMWLLQFTMQTIRTANCTETEGMREGDLHNIINICVKKTTLSLRGIVVDTQMTITLLAEVNTTGRRREILTGLTVLRRLKS